MIQQNSKKNTLPTTLSTEIPADAKQLLKLVQDYFESAHTFEANTKFSTVKAGEVYVSIIVNQWLIRNNLEGQIKITKAHKGFDGIVVHTKDSEKLKGVEIKTCQKSKEFRFSRDFQCKTHGLIVLAEMEEGKVNRIFIAHGAMAMEALQKDLDADKKRAKYDESISNMPRLFSTARKESKYRGASSVGMVELAKNPDTPWDINNMICDLDKTDIQDLLESLNS